jgi:hypothetical protein
MGGGDAREAQDEKGSLGLQMDQQMFSSHPSLNSASSYEKKIVPKSLFE